MANNTDRTPALRVEAAPGVVGDFQPPEYRVYRIYADGVEIASVAGDEYGVELRFPGQLDRQAFHPDHLLGLVRVSAPQQTRGLSNEEIAERVSAVASLTAEHDLLDIVTFDLRSGQGAGNYRRMVLSGKAHDHRLDVELDDAVTSISHLSRVVPGTGDDSKPPSPKPHVGHSALRPFYWRTRALLMRRPTNRLGPEGADECKGSERHSHRRYRFQSFRMDRRCLGLNRRATSPGNAVRDAGTYVIKQDASVPWHKQTMEFVRGHHSSSLLARIDCATLAARITQVSQRIVAQTNPLGGAQLH